ncbi:MAG: LolA family protein [Tepidisphaeraceae bacterium]
MTQRKHSTFIASVAGVLWAASAWAQVAATSPADAFEQRLQAINAKTAHVADLTADFVQEKQSPLLKKPIVSRGHLLAKGGRSLWQTAAPQPQTMASDPQTLRLYFPDRNVIEVYPVRSQWGMLAASPLPRLDDLEKTFTLAPDSAAGLADENTPKDSIAIRMTPRNDQIKQYVDHVRVLLDADRGLVLAFEMTDPDGEVTRLRFSDIRVDTGVPDSAVELHAPADVKVVKPLGDSGVARP